MGRMKGTREPASGGAGPDIAPGTPVTFTDDRGVKGRGRVRVAGHLGITVVDTEGVVHRVTHGRWHEQLTTPPTRPGVLAGPQPGANVDGDGNLQDAPGELDMGEGKPEPGHTVAVHEVSWREAYPDLNRYPPDDAPDDMMIKVGGAGDAWTLSWKEKGKTLRAWDNEVLVQHAEARFEHLQAAAKKLSPARHRALDHLRLGPRSRRGILAAAFLALDALDGHDPAALLEAAPPTIKGSRVTFPGRGPIDHLGLAHTLAWLASKGTDGPVWSRGGATVTVAALDSYIKGLTGNSSKGLCRWHCTARFVEALAGAKGDPAAAVRSAAQAVGASIGKGAQEAMTFYIDPTVARAYLTGTGLPDPQLQKAVVKLRDQLDEREHRLADYLEDVAGAHVWAHSEDGADAGEDGDDGQDQAEDAPADGGEAGES